MSDARDRAKIVLVASVVLTLALYVIPFGQYVAYPLVLLSTVPHEMGHGTAALLVGGRWSSFHMWANGSGVAYVAAPLGVRSAIVSAGGLVGPAFAAAFGFLFARREKTSRIFFGVLAGLLLVAEIALVRGGFAMFFVGLLVAIFGGIAWKGRGWFPQLALVFLSVQLALSVFSRGDYLFMKVAHTGAGVSPSDTSHMSQAIGGPYWMWGLVCGAFSIAALAAGGFLYLRKPRGERATKTVDGKSLPADPLARFRSAR
jgi:hypothetical protein